MADGNSHPFNSDVIASETLSQYHKQSASHHITLNASKNHQHKPLLDLLSANHTSNHFFNSNDPSLNIASPTISDDDLSRLKSLVRSTIWPVDHQIRRQLWMNILTFNRVSSSSKSATHSITLTPVSPTSLTVDLHFNSLPLKTNQWPNFVDTSNLCFYHLNDSTGRSSLQRILFTFALHHPDLTYCPALEPFSALLLHYFNENEVLFLINRLLQKHWLCGETRLQWEANWNVFRKLLKTYFKSNADAIDLRYTNSKGFYQEWFWWILRYLPFPYLVKVMDCFFLEGPKILYRVGLALVHLYMKTVKDESNTNSRTIAEFCQQIPVTIEHLLRVAFQIRNLKRRTIEHLVHHEERLLHNTRHYNRTDENETINSNNNNNNNSSTFSHNSINPSLQNNSIDHQSSFVTHQHLTRIPPKSILDHQQFLTIWNWLPARFSLAQPSLIFTTEDHGFRLQTLLEKLDEVEYSIIIVRATNGEIFGAFCAGAWAERHNKTYFGFGESFLFTLTPKQSKYPWVGQNQIAGQQSLSDSEQRQTQVKRELFLFVNHEKLIVGGGNGDGLCIDASLCEGRTAHCETFNNQPLCSSTDFSISVLEMITFDFSSS